jgi:preprotein translocase subunit SecG
MEVVKIILTILEVVSSAALILVVLFQSGKEAGLSGAIAGGNQDTYLSKSKNGSLDKMLASATKWIALAWILLTLALSFF